MPNYIDTIGLIRRSLSVSAGLQRLPGLLALWGERSRQRQALAALDDRALRDIGLNRSDALEEVRKPFWRA